MISLKAGAPFALVKTEFTSNDFAHKIIKLFISEGPAYTFTSTNHKKVIRLNGMFLIGN